MSKRGKVAWPDSHQEHDCQPETEGERYQTPVAPNSIPYPDDNPKTILGISKPGIKAIPASALYHLGMAMADGENKYGLYNYREKTVSSSIYFEANQRHVWSWWDGENHAADSRIHHLAHAMACCAIILDAMECAKLNDDRGPPGTLPSFLWAHTKGRKK